MQYTGNVNKFAWYVALPAVGLLYLAFLTHQYLTFDDGGRQLIASQLIETSHSRVPIDGVILGGSNAVFSLSAEVLSQFSGIKWINLALLNQAYSDENYWNFIRQALTTQHRSGVQEVVYSSLAPLRGNLLMERSGRNIDLGGGPEFTLVPKRSMASLLMARLSGDELVPRYPHPNEYGDFVFDEFECNSVGSASFQRNVNEAELDAWVSSELRQLEELFPNATINFVVPSEYYGQHFDADTAQKTDGILRASVERFAQSSSNTIRFIKQSLLPDNAMLCDTIHHANEAGRYWRTTQLYEYLKAQTDIP